MTTQNHGHPARATESRPAARDSGNSRGPAALSSAPARVSVVDGAVPLVRFELSLKSLFVVLALLACAWMLVHLLPALLVLVVALMLVGALNPVVTRLEQRRMPRFLAICLVFGVSATVAVGLLAFTVPTVLAQVKTIAEQAPVYRERIAGYLEQSRLTATLADDIRNVRYTQLLKSSQTTLLTAGTRMVEVVAYSVAAVFLAFYAMIDRDRLRGMLFAVVPRSHHIRLSRILLNLGTIVGGYLRGQVLTCLLMGGFVFGLLVACRVPNALAIAVFGGVADLLPFIGIFLTMGPAVLAASMKGPAIAGIVFVLMLTYEEFESRVLVPLVYGRTLRLPPSAVLFSLILGTTLAGIIGALLALPLAAAVLMLVDELRVELPGETMQPEDLAQRREDNRTEQEYERRVEHMSAEQAAAVAVEITDNRKKEEGVTERAHAAAEAKAGRPPE